MLEFYMSLSYYYFVSGKKFCAFTNKDYCLI